MYKGLIISKDGANKKRIQNFDQKTCFAFSTLKIKMCGRHDINKGLA